ncbi:hypothetical protein Ptr902_09729 [Pyrenophora tritici-repentis]|uniref:Uncharacterized protein n=2 Tax=Pyrenophora tritici-repentis TaxID=45151 RepID=A0A5M9KW89_9PLEO|nr:uncharacterized protein PTRG_07001 [Pyrenophora tritici-repentis Pt-1C-BFP]KAA8614553.1 hypothetical protein PtrV1_11583 [Pyrenophora tritici-repentis]EDU49920.1 predicted protein [Pyrenophora tritici-repentis Pt-1C-BFP]KAF7444387.1 hypothetical protein A1F99_109400 [Pyrenophora tritici-repentis]KAF7564962.1 hypothetical protein PtrM4_043960 [Pyrenophora tritici-repentis]KAI0586132.1 hypothetical protein Alg215_02184 [Pyrenophora tritici-repentis]
MVNLKTMVITALLALSVHGLDLNPIGKIPNEESKSCGECADNGVHCTGKSACWKVYGQYTCQGSGDCV